MRIILRAIALSVCCGLIVAGGMAHAQSPRAKIYLSPAEIEAIRKGSGCRSLVRQFLALQDRMNAGNVQTDFYDLNIMPTNELVKNRRGRYYVVYLKDASQRARFRFPGGRYVIQDFETRFRRAMSSFVREVLAVIEGGADYEIFVRGSSSNSPMSRRRTLREDFNFAQIGYLPKIAADRYAALPPAVHTVPNAYTNDDLPFLRAAFMKDVVKRFYPLKEPKVLQSEVAQSASATAQFAELILFVDW